MKNFAEFIIENALVKKLTAGFNETPVEIPGADIIHHDKSTKTTVYHLKTPEACYKFGSSAGFCTNTPNKEYAHSYLKKGNLFGVIKNQVRFQHYQHNLDNKYNETKDEDNVSYDPERILPAKVLKKISNMPHTGFNKDWNPLENKTDDQVVNMVKKLEKEPRRNVLLHIQQGTSYSGGTDDEMKMATRLNRSHLHNFHDDPDHHVFIAQTAPIDDIGHLMYNHHDSYTRGIVRKRVAEVGGLKALRTPMETGYHSDSEDQLSFKFPKTKIKQKK